MIGSFFESYLSYSFWNSVTNYEIIEIDCLAAYVKSNYKINVSFGVRNDKHSGIDHRCHLFDLTFMPELKSTLSICT